MPKTALICIIFLHSKIMLINIYIYSFNKVLIVTSASSHID